MEWMRIPSDLAGYVVGKSSWGRRGLVIATAVGIHPGFSGCLTLEITNLGEMPIKIMPGMQICQLFLHDVSTDSQNKDQSTFVGKRRPSLGAVRPDPIAEQLARKSEY
jgi:dCTP deaminase